MAIKTMENPITKYIALVTTNLFAVKLLSSCISFIDAPVKKHKYEGIIGKTQGDKKLKRPAIKHTKINKSIFHKYTLISNISNYK